MKRLFIAASLVAALASPAFAKSQQLNANISIATGKGGIVGALLGTLKGQNGLVTNVNVNTTKNGILGLVLGSGGGHGGCGCGY